MRKRREAGQRRPEKYRTLPISANSQNVYFVSIEQQVSIYSGLGEGVSL